MFLPSRRCIILCFSLSPLWLLPGGSFFAFWGLLLFVLLSGMDLASLPNQHTLKLKRRLPKAFYWGQPCTLALDLCNTGRFSFRGVLFDDLPDALGRTCKELTWKVRPDETQTFEWEVTPQRRGLTSLGLTVLRVSGRLGLWKREITVDLSQEIALFPKLAPSEKDGLLTRGPRFQHGRPRQQHREGEFDHIRPMREGDSWRDVDWKCSSRKDRWVVRERRMEPGRQVAVFVDCGRLMGDQVGQHSRLDHAINASIQLARLAEQEGDSFTLSAFSQRIEAHVPLARKGQVHRSLKALYPLQVQATESDYWKVAGQALHRLGKRSLVILFTDMLDPCASKGLLSHLCSAAQQHVVLCVLLQDPAVEKETQSEDPNLRAAACFLMLQRSVAIAEMRRRGVVVLEAEAEAFQSRVLRNYLELRERT